MYTGKFWLKGKSNIYPFKIKSGFDFVKETISYSRCSFKSEHPKINIYKKHAYNINGITEENGIEYVKLINPWNSNIEIKLSKKDFDKNVKSIDCIELK